MPYPQQFNLLVDASGHAVSQDAANALRVLLVDSAGNLLLPGAPKQADVNATGAGNTQVVAAVTAKKIRVTWILVTNADSGTIKVKLQSATTDITAQHEIASEGGGFAVNASPGWFCETAAGAALNVNLAAGGDVAVTVGYVEV